MSTELAAWSHANQKTFTGPLAFSNDYLSGVPSLPSQPPAGYTPGIPLNVFQTASYDISHSVLRRFTANSSNIALRTPASAPQQMCATIDFGKKPVRQTCLQVTALGPPPPPAPPPGTVGCTGVQVNYTYGSDAAVSTPQQLGAMTSGKSYYLTQDIVLDGSTGLTLPLSTILLTGFSLEGNNKKITIKNFSTSSSVLGGIGDGSLVQNLLVDDQAKGISLFGGGEFHWKASNVQIFSSTGSAWQFALAKGTFLNMEKTCCNNLIIAGPEKLNDSSTVPAFGGGIVGFTGQTSGCSG